MARYELFEGEQTKFWEIEQTDATLTTTWGTVGGEQKSFRRTYPSAEAAARDHDKQIADKLQKRYLPAGAVADAARAARDQAELEAQTIRPRSRRERAARAEVGLGGLFRREAALKHPAPTIEQQAAAHGARRFERADQFWTIWIADATVRVWSGAAGGTGEVAEESFETIAEARRARDAQIAARIAEGYAEAGPRPTVDARNAELERAILADPYDASAYAVYADWLQEQGDPRGELIALQLSGQHEAARALLTRHADALLGDLADHAELHDGSRRHAFTWEAGFIRSVQLSHHTSVSALPDGLRGVLAAVLAHPSGRFLAEISIGIAGETFDSSLQDLIDLLVERAPPTLRKLHLGDFAYGSDTEMSWYSVGDLGALWSAVPRLTTLIVQGGDFRLGAIDLPALASATFRTGGLSRDSAHALARAHWPQLERLEIWYGDPEYGGDATADDVAPLLARTDLPRLRHLGLRNAAFTDALCPLIVASPLVRQLRSLDLSLGCL
ncbi:MAG: TIGR02996 domain-containing protein, partial [Kofleriaceae bacterium]